MSNRIVEPCSSCGKEILRRNIKTDRDPVCSTCKSKHRQIRSEERQMRKAVDWLAVDHVVDGKPMRGLTTAEVRMVVRALSDRMVGLNESNHDLPPWRWTATKVAELLHMSQSNIIQVRSRLPKATKRRCPECRGDMWVLDENGTVEEHGNGFHETCSMTNRLGRQVVGLLPVPQALLVLRCYSLAVAS